MRRLLVVFSVLLSSVVLSAQEHPKYELFGGYSYLRGEGTNFNGWEASGAYNFNRWIGLNLDVDGHYHSDSSNSFIAFHSSQKVHDALVGPQFSWRAHRWTLFAHTLFGFSHASLHTRVDNAPPPFPSPFIFDESHNDLGVALGGGGDWNFGKRWAARVQADYLQSSAPNFTKSDNFRFSTGLVFRFGAH